MEIGRTIIKKIIVVLEGCVVKLKEFDAYLEGKKEENRVLSTSIGSTIPTRNYDKVKKTSTENYYNISYLDTYVQSLGLPLGTNFMKILQRTELQTEYNLIEVMIGSLSNDITVFEKLYSNIQDSNYVVFQYIQPSPLREEEKKVVDKNFVYEELKDSGILYDEKKSLYDNSLKVIEAKQKHVMEDIVKRFDSIIEKIHVSNDDAKRREIIKILIKEMNNRKYILEMKMKR